MGASCFTLKVVPHCVPCRFVRMAYLAVAASHSVNGVAAIHSDIIKNTIFKDFADLFPGRMHTKQWLFITLQALSRRQDAAATDIIAAMPSLSLHSSVAGLCSFFSVCCQRNMYARCCPACTPSSSAARTDETWLRLCCCVVQASSRTRPTV